ncbi:MAG: hypothetical protein WKF57_17370 [Nakamurella sp.]
MSAPLGTQRRPPDHPLTSDEIAVVRSWAAATWGSMEAMTHPTTGLPADHIRADLDPAGRSGYTSPTNIGGLLWSTVVARDGGLISPAECRERLRATLARSPAWTGTQRPACGGTGTTSPTGASSAFSTVGH